MAHVLYSMLTEKLEAEKVSINLQLHNCSGVLLSEMRSDNEGMLHCCH